MNINIKITFGLIIFSCFLPTSYLFAQGVSINETGNPPSGCALLDIQPDVNFNKGLLLPRLTTAQRATIAAPIEGLIIYNTTTSCFEIYNGSVWYSLGCQCSGAPAATTASAASNVTSGGFTANWGGVVDATTFYLDVATDAGFTTIVTGYNNLNVGNVTSYAVTGLNCNTTYYYRLRAANPCGISVSSNTISQLTSASPPSAPIAGTATNITGSSFTANWTNTGGTTYYLDVATDVGFTAFVTGYNNLNVGNVLSYNITGLGCNSIYYYRVRAYSSCGTSPSSNTITTTTGTSAPSAPTANAATNVTGGSFTANWSSVSDATLYYLDVATDVGFTVFASGYNNLNVGNNTTYNVIGLNCNTTYYYRVRAANGCGTSASSNIVTQATGSSVPSAPTASSATSISATSFSANCSAVGSATKYYLDVATDVGFTAFVAGYNNLDVGNVTTYNVTGLTCGILYYYRVRAYNPCGTSANSNTITVTTRIYCAWLYKVPVTITNTGGALSNYQVQITLNTQALISGGKMQSGGQDIRVTDSDKCTAVDFWFEPSTINTTTTQIWVEVPSISASSTKTIYVYYGNGTASSAGDGDNTFSFFDNFGTFNAIKWTATGAYSVASSEITITTGAVYSDATVASQPGFISEAKVKWNDVANGYSGLEIANAQSTQGSNSGSNKLVYLMKNTGSGVVTAWAANGTAASYNITSGTTQFTATVGTSYIIGHAVSGTQVIYYNNRAVTNSYAGTWSGAYYLWLGYFTGSTSGATNISDIAVDWVLVRQYASPAPTTGNGSEEVGCN